MSYFINNSVYANMFSLPVAVAEKHLKLATAEQLKVLLYIFRNPSNSIDESAIAAALSLPLSEVSDALVFWEQCEILLSDSKEKTQEKEEKAVVVKAEMPTRSDVIKRGMEDEGLKFLLREAQMKFGRNLKQNESALLVSLYDDNGMDASVILLLLQYAVSCNKCNLSFIRSTAVKWIKSGVETVLDAEKMISESAKNELAWRFVEGVFGIERRNPSEREKELANLWVNEWGLSREMLKLGYDACVDVKTRLDMRYVAKIFENWQKAGYKTPQDVNSAQKNKKTQTKQKDSYAGYDLELFEKMLNEDD